MSKFITLLETPRDALQGLPRAVPTAEKIAYLKLILECGFKRMDFGSFVSPRAIPQMADSAEVFAAIAAPAQSRGTELLAIVANARGLETGLQLGVTQFGFPFSISDEFQRRNTGKSIADTWPVISAMGDTARAAGARLAIYLSMAFGNPYHEPFTPQLLTDFARRCADAGFTELSLSDTVGAASPSLATALIGNVTRALPGAQLGVHFHCRPDQVAMADAALDGGISWFDCALGGIGGCPFAQDKLVGNMATPALVEHLHGKGHETGVNIAALQVASQAAMEIAGKYGAA
jgi:hydroxymethylglutaryl-CoA lyase